ncbi:hypothetical protein RB195_018123 [Necator americanus]|uniref:Uncharacterized protein n=1 Tax=Necator americanus TaxID=51031 RepID=A0ABR1CAP0_NECAM
MLTYEVECKKKIGCIVHLSSAAPALGLNSLFDVLHKRDEDYRGMAPEACEMDSVTSYSHLKAKKSGAANTNAAR